MSDFVQFFQTFRLPLALAAQAEGIGLNAATLAVVSGIVLAMAGTIAALFKWATSNQQKQIDNLTEDNRLLMEALIDVLRTANRAGDVADDAAKELLKRRVRKPR